MRTFSCLFFSLWLSLPVSAQNDLLSFVNPFIGTAAHGHTYPGATVPFGMVQLSPDTRLTGWDGCSGYHFTDSLIYGFSHTHLSGTGVPDYCDLLFQPFTDAIPLENAEYSSPFSKSSEKAEAGYYAVTLNKYRIRAEMTATAHVGVQRYTFPLNRTKGSILLDLRHRDSVLDASLRIVNSREVEGTRFSNSWAKEQKLYFVTRFSRPFYNSIALDMSQNPREAQRHVHSKSIVGVFQFYNDDGPVVVTTAISAVSIADARQQLAAECDHFDFDRVKREAQDIWRKQLSKIEVEGGTKSQKTTFYTALYHTMCAPHHFGNHPDGHTVFSLWDTYRAAHPLYTLLEPSRSNDFIRGLLAYYRRKGDLPVWPLWGEETDCMIGNHAISVIADAYVKGIRDYDVRTALEATRHATRRNRFGQEFYRSHGYVPAQHESESVSKTLEYAYDDWCAGVLAQEMGLKDSARVHFERAQNYKNIFDPASSFFRAKNNATWHRPFDPTEVNFHYTEANAWHYRFAVPHDVQGMIAAFGGKIRFTAALDSLFGAASQTTGRDQVDITGRIGQYAHGNEPSHHVAYLYNYAGQPWKTQRRVRQIMDELYTDQPDGLCGNEDCGQMSAWYVFSALGFYPLAPGRPEYTLGTPLFEKVTLRLENGRSFVIEAPESASAKCYVQNVLLNGKRLPANRLLHADIVQGGNLKFEMGANPGSFGVSEQEQSISAIDKTPFTPVPYIVANQRAFRGKQSVSLLCSDPAAAVWYAVRQADAPLAFRLYSKPLSLDKTTELVFYAEKNGMKSQTDEASFYQIPEGLNVKTYHTRYNPQYAAGGDQALTDGLRGNSDFRTGGWQGFEGKDAEITLDLGKKQKIERVAAGFLQDANSWIFFPTALRVSASTDGEKFDLLGTATHQMPASASGTLIRNLEVKPSGEFARKKYRYLRVTALTPGTCPAGHPGAGLPCWIFIDEIQVQKS